MKKGFKIALLLSVVLFVASLYFGSFIKGTFSSQLVTALAVISLVAPVMIYSFLGYSKAKAKEVEFPSFLLDIANSLEIGMSLPSTMESLTHNNYKTLSGEAKKMHIQMTWGENFAEVFERVAEDSGSELIEKTGHEVLATVNAGGELSKVLKGVANSMQDYQDILRERKSQMYENMMTGYLVFLIFLGIVFVLMSQLVPLIQVTPLGVPSATPAEYKIVLFNFTLVEALCIGLIVGKMSEGSITAGFKHMLILATLTVLTFALL
jgi:flagellar protein FlaJ